MIVTIVGIDSSSQVFYTFTDDQAANVYVESKQSNVFAVAPFQTLYLLDYASSRNGWLFNDQDGVPLDPCTVSHPPPGEPVLTPPSHQLLANKLVLLTLHPASGVCAYRLKFFNWITSARTSDDPQEANIKQPT